LSAGTIAPWDMVLEARRQGLDVLALTPHNVVFGADAARWFSRLTGGPLILAGEEIHSEHYHMIGVGIQSTITWRGTARQSIDEVHRQGGIGIAAHPMASSWAAWDGETMARLDGAEVQQPIVFAERDAERDLEAFFARGHFAAIGSS